MQEREGGQALQASLGPSTSRACRTKRRVMERCVGREGSSKPGVGGAEDGGDRTGFSTLIAAHQNWSSSASSARAYLVCVRECVEGRGDAWREECVLS